MSSRPTPRDKSSRFWLVTTASATTVAGIGAALALILIGSDTHPRHVMANNISRNFRACLVTSDPGSPAAQAGWAGLRAAANSGPVNSQRIITPPSATTTEALLPYLESLVQRKCGLIIGAGPHLNAAVTAAAAKNPHQHFLIASTASKSPNVTALPTLSAHDVANAVRSAARRTAHSPTAST